MQLWATLGKQSGWIGLVCVFHSDEQGGLAC